MCVIDINTGGLRRQEVSTDKGRSWEKDRSAVEVVVGRSAELGRTVVEELAGRSQEQGRTAVAVLEGRRLAWDAFSLCQSVTDVVTWGLFMAVMHRHGIEDRSSGKRVVIAVASKVVARGDIRREYCYKSANDYR